VLGLIVDLAAADAERLPARETAVTEISGIALPRLAVAPGVDPYLLVLAALRTAESDQ
jgi:HPr kinase/phosphorylase